MLEDGRVELLGGRRQHQHNEAVVAYNPPLQQAVVRRDEQLVAVEHLDLLDAKVAPALELPAGATNLVVV